MSAITSAALGRYFEAPISDPNVGSGGGQNPILTVGAWAKTITLNVAQSILALSKTTTPNRAARVWHRGDQANDPWSGQAIASGGTVNRDAGNYVDGNWVHLLFQMNYTALTVRSALNGTWSATTAIAQGNIDGVNRANVGAVWAGAAVTQIFSGNVAGVFAALQSLSAQQVTDLQTQWPDQVSGLTPIQANRMIADGLATHGVNMTAVGGAVFDANDNPIAVATGNRRRRVICGASA